MDGHTSRSSVAQIPGDSAPAGYKVVRRNVIDIDAPGMREAIADAVKRINKSEEAEHMLAELDIGMAESWALLPE
jgi:hypothetical protein